MDLRQREVANLTDGECERALPLSIGAEARFFRPVDSPTVAKLAQLARLHSVSRITIDSLPDSLLLAARFSGSLVD